MDDITLKFYNTETRKQEVLAPLKDRHFRIYTCGPTVYDFAHIGNLRTYVFEDLLRRTLEFFGMKVTQVMNITDVDDKTIRGANEKGVSLDKYTKPYCEAFFEDLKTLGIEPAEHYPLATEFISHMIKMIEKLLEKGIAYRGKDGSIYYAINKFKGYGRLSHLNLDDLQEGASERVDTDEYEKENASDFVLWKKYDPKRDQEIYWESPFGAGRPGWHLECSAMALNLLGPEIDIHCGGVDNIFPHHENEIAQAEAYSKDRFVRFWMHSEHLIIEGKKMSKSLGNFFTLRDLLEKGFSGKQLRYMFLHTHYRKQLNFTMEGLKAAHASLQRLNDFILRLQEIRGEATSKGSIEEIAQHASKQFSGSLADDLNISAALAAVFDLVHDGNVACEAGQVGEKEAKLLLDLLEHFDSVLVVMTFEQDETIPQELQEMLEKRQQARKNKDWALADQLRDAINEHGYTIEDTSEGPRLKYTHRE